MVTKQEYKPLLGVEGFYLEKTDNSNCEYLFWNNSPYKIPVGPKRIIPKSGLCFFNILKDRVKNKNVLDLGCGEMGILSLFSIYHQAKNVLAVDIDSECVNWLNTIKKMYKIKNLEAKTSNMFEKVTQHFDIIVSNPPIMPMQNITSDVVHDSGGKDGRLFLKTIMKEALNFLTPKGSLILSAFSFLGTNTRTNNDISLKEYAISLGYTSFEIVKQYNKILSSTSVTYQQLPYIKQIYPNAYIEDLNNKIVIKYQIIEIKR